MTEIPDDVPEPSEQLDQRQAEDTLLERGVEDILDEGYSPSERWSAAEGFGNTPQEEATGETLEQRLTQEVPDVGADLEADARRTGGLEAGDTGAEFLDDGEVGDARAGRLVDPDEGIAPDVDAELVGDDVGIDAAGSSAEEAAVHVVDDSASDS